MSDHRYGRGQIKTADELVRDLAIPVVYILLGRAQPAFPYTGTHGPSHFVQVVRTGALVDSRDVSAFPAYCNWRQWNDIIVPVIEDERWPNWFGSLGGQSSTTGFGIPGRRLGAGLYHGLVDDLTEQVSGQMFELSIALGYGSPDQTTPGTC